jgi:hypothetical protein
VAATALVFEQRERELGRAPDRCRYLDKRAPAPRLPGYVEVARRGR